MTNSDLIRPSLEAGINWSREIEERVLKASAFVLCISEQFHSRKDSFVHKELNIAKSVLANMHPSELWYFPVLIGDASIPRGTIAPDRHLSDYQTTIAFPDLTVGISVLVERLRRFIDDPVRNKGKIIFVNQARTSGYVRINGEYARDRLLPGVRIEVVVASGSHTIDFVDHDPVDNGDYNHLERNFNSNILNITVNPKDVLILLIRTPKSEGHLWWRKSESDDAWIVEVISKASG